tara:strand:+ start:30595 stop:32394 length:1800 start_codon:yes stop_codon:yes gene_type:complete
MSIPKKNKSNLTRLWVFLSKRRKLEIIQSFCLILISAFSEILSLATFIPFLIFLSNPEKLFKIKFVFSISRFLNIDSPDGLLIPVTLLFALFAVLSSLMKIINFRFNSLLAARIGSDLSQKSFSNNLYQNYTYHLNKNSSSLISTIAKHTDTTVFVIEAILSIITNTIISLSVITGLIILNWKVALSTGFIISFSYILFIAKTKSYLRKNSELMAKYNAIQIKIMQESISSIKEILVGKKQAFFNQSFKNADYNIRILTAIGKFLGVFPRYGVEGLSILIFCGLTFSLLVLEKDLASIIPLLGGLALGVQKLIPQIQQIYYGCSKFLMFYKDVELVLDMIEQKVEIYSTEQFPISTKQTFFNNEIVLKNISYKYSEKSNLILNKINIKIKKGEKVGFIGSTGCGKSTLLNIIMGLLQPTEGEILVDNKNINKKSNVRLLYNWQKNIAIVPQTINLLDRSILENIAFAIPTSDINFEKVYKAAAKANIENFISSCPEGYHTNIGERGIRISGGELQRIGIARALYENPSILLLDEATSAIDTKTELELVNNLSTLDQDITIIMIAHRLVTLKNFDRIFELKDGKIINEFNNREFNKIKKI